MGRRKQTTELATLPAPAEVVEEVFLDEGDIPETAHIRRWGAGQTSQGNARFFSRNSRGPAAINRDCVLRLTTLIENCRNEISRSPFLQGVIDLDSTLLVGEHGPRIDLTCDAPGGDAWANEAEAVINEWAEDCDIAGERSLVDFLFAINRGLWSDGCGLLEERSARRSDSPVSLRFALHDPLYLVTPPELTGDHHTVMGIEVDPDTGRPIRYHIGNPVDRTYDFVASLNTEPRPADLVYHVVDRLHMEAGQLRGVPYAASTLEASAQLRTLDKSILDALETAARANIVLQSNDPKLANHTKLLKGTMALNRTGATAIPPGYNAAQLAPAHPHQKYLELAESLLSQIGRPVSMPATMVLGSFRTATFSAGRMDGGMHSKSVSRRRGLIQRRFLNPSIRTVITEATRARAIRRAPGPYQIVLTWPSAIIQPDPVKHFLAQQIALANGTLSDSQACAENGVTLESVIRQRVRDRDAFLAAGLPLPAHLAATQTGLSAEQFERLTALLEANQE